MPNISGLYSQSTGLPAIERLYKPFAFYVRMLFSFGKEQGNNSASRFFNKQLRLYLRQEGRMVSGNKEQLVERILKHAEGL